MPVFRKFLPARPVLIAAAWIGVFGLSVAAVCFSYSWSKRIGYAQLGETAAHRLDLYATGLESELGKHEYLPGVLALDQAVLALLAAPDDPQLLEQANQRLANVNVRAGSLATLVMDKDGLVRAASNWYQSDSAVGKDLSKQPYFADAVRNGQAHFFARGAARDAPEYYFAQPVLREGALLGVVVVKISLEPIESTWIASASQTNPEIFLVLDENDVIIIASAPDWKNQKTNLLSLMLRARRENEPPTELIVPFNMASMEILEHGSHVLGPPAPRQASPRKLYTTQERSMLRQGWRMVTLSDAGSVIVNARQTAFGVGVLSAFIGLLGVYLAQRRSALASRLRAREALQQAHDELELRIARRTAELHQMNQELLREIGERKRAEQVLRESQDDLLHASRLAVLGQISAGVTHEINQPLTALRSLSYNTRLLLTRGETERVDKNLQSIADLAERMGRLTEQLKSFARKAPPMLGPVLLAKAVENTLLLLENRIRTEEVALQVDIDGALLALCDANRLEQVLINLCANALDAMSAAPAKTLAIAVWRADGRAWVRVGDSGPGIPPEVMGRLFEPFFSTKLSGQGLGLGLAISADIVREFGGALLAHNLAGGAAFEFDLNLIEENSHV
ncbi:ATP-binding protein [Janthinobacterium sp. CG_S6]|uniref:ATP-binding protein n=1 Tax=Janthinobacterium sp. CG_S6 TaxID=3071707 RepID=UPI002E073C6F|nr:C4-dicarboxylate-specific signal transduction histidine kinase [Janthinobacterium sp. CG_S6]